MTEEESSEAFDRIETRLTGSAGSAGIEMVETGPDGLEESGGLMTVDVSPDQSGPLETGPDHPTPSRDFAFTLPYPEGQDLLVSALECLDSAGDTDAIETILGTLEAVKGREWSGGVEILHELRAGLIEEFEDVSVVETTDHGATVERLTGYVWAIGFIEEQMASRG